MIASYSANKEDDEYNDNMEYYDSLKEKILDCLTCMFQDIQKKELTSYFKRYVNDIIGYINKINSGEFRLNKVLLL